METIKTDIKKINAIIHSSDSDYNCETPEHKRSAKFCSAFNRMMKKLFPECEIFGCVGYCEVSGFIKNVEGKIIYYSTEDYRWPLMGKSIWDSILYRTADYVKDFRGGSNNYSDIEHLRDNVLKLFLRMEVK